jgi:hypothetical protein
MSDKEKLQIRTKTASLAIRGTEFSIVYNQLNETTTAIGYSGDVRFSTALKNGRSYAKDSVALKPGEFSSTFTKKDYVSSPTKMSPRQFQLLQENNDLKTRLKKPINKKVNIKIPKELLATKKKASQQVPKELLGNGHGQILESEIARKKEIRAGGYIDLNTGIYIEPPVTAKYDSNKGVFEVPQTFGGLDPETGEYVPPLGLILHPLKGFTSAASLIQEGVKYVANKTVDFADSALTKSGEFGSKLIDGAGALGQALEDNTGIVGKAVGAPVRFAGNMAKKSVGAAYDLGKKTTEYISDKGLSSLNMIADNMNSYLYHGVLDKVGSTLKKFPLVSQLELTFRNDFSWSDIQRFRVYDQVNEVVSVPTFHNDFHFSALYKKTLWNKIFVRPKFGIQKKNHLRDQISQVRELDNYKYIHGIDIGAIGKVKDYLIQTYFYADFSSQFRFDQTTKSHERYLWDKSFGFSKIIISPQKITSKFDITYRTYRSGRLGDGRILQASLSEILNIRNKNFINMTLNWSKRERKGSDKNILLYGAKLDYFFVSKLSSFKANTWLEYSLAEDQLFPTRGREKNKSIGLRLIKNFPRFFSTAFIYKIEDIESKLVTFDNSAHTASIVLNATY